MTPRQFLFGFPKKIFGSPKGVICVSKDSIGFPKEIFGSPKGISQIVDQRSQTSRFSVGFSGGNSEQTVKQPKEVFSRKHRVHCLKAVPGYWCKIAKHQIKARQSNNWPIWSFITRHSAS